MHSDSGERLAFARDMVLETYIALHALHTLHDTSLGLERFASLSPASIELAT